MKHIRLHTKRLPLFALLFSVFLSQNGFTQQVQIGIKGGLSLPNLSSTGGSAVSKGYKTISGPDFALVADFPVAEKISVEAGLEWSTQGGQKTGLQTIPASPELAQYFPPGTSAQYLYANFTSTVRLQYLMLPILLKYTMDLDQKDHWKLYWDGGIFGALLITAKGSAVGSGNVFFDKEETNQVGSATVQFDSTGDIKNQLHKGNFGLEGNIGLLYKGKSISAFVEGGANFGFINLQKSDQNGMNRTGALVFRIGIFAALPAGK